MSIELVFIFGMVLLISILWSLWSLRDLKAPKQFYPKIQRGVRKVLAGVIHLPQARSSSSSE